MLDILLAVFRDGVYSNYAVHAALEKYQYFSKRERAFITKVSEGTVERQIEIDYIIDQFSTVPVEKMKPVIQNILRSAVYQIRYLGSVPNSAAVSEAVQLAQNRGFYNLKGFVNGVLRNIARNADNIRYPDPGEDPVRYLSITKSMPEWLTKAFLDEYGPVITERILNSFLEERPTTVRIKTERIGRNEILTSLRNQGVTVRHAPYLPYAYNLIGYNYLMALNAFKNGWIYPQDVSSMLVTEAADPKPGDNVIDLCAAPGGKSLHIADRMAGYGMVEARDVSVEKVELIAENVRRANVINVHPVVKDALGAGRDRAAGGYQVPCDAGEDRRAGEAPASDSGKRREVREAGRGFHFQHMHNDPRGEHRKRQVDPGKHRSHPGKPGSLHPAGASKTHDGGRLSAAAAGRPRVGRLLYRALPEETAIWKQSMKARTSSRRTLTSF